jgi:hypothetical protein
VNGAATQSRSPNAFFCVEVNESCLCTTTSTMSGVAVGSVAATQLSIPIADAGLL